MVVPRCGGLVLNVDLTVKSAIGTSRIRIFAVQHGLKHTDKAYRSCFGRWPVGWQWEGLTAELTSP